MNYDYGLEMMMLWAKELLDLGSSGVVIGLPKSGRKRTMAEVFGKLSMEDDWTIVDGAGGNLGELRGKLKEATLSGVRMVYVDGLDVGRTETKTRLEFLLGLREEFKKKFNYIFAPKGDPLIAPERLKSMLVNSSVIYFPYADKGEFGKLVVQNEARYAIRTTRRERDRVFALSGGCPFVVKALFRRLSQGKSLEIDEDLEMVGMSWLEGFGTEDRGLITRMGGLSVSEKESLVRRGFVDGGGKGRSELARTLLESGKLKGRQLGLGESGVLVVDGQVLERPFSPTERDVLSLLLVQGIVKREGIARICFPDGGYSEEALDQVMSRIRKKLGRAGVDPTSLTTLKKVGYEWRKEDKNVGV